MKRENFFSGIVFGILLTAFSGYVLLDTFVIPRAYESVQESDTDAEANREEEQSFSSENSTTDVENESTSDAAKAEGSFEDGTLIGEYSEKGNEIHLYEYRYLDTDVYVADIVLASANGLKTAFAQNVYGKNVTDKTSSIAKEHDAVLAVNGDFYGTREGGFVIRNGVLYREERAGSNQEDLVIDREGDFEIFSEEETLAEDLMKKGARQVFSFGPALVMDGDVCVAEGEEVGKAMASNPRTAIGQMGNLHYLFVVSDGRTRGNAGLSLSELAEFMKERKVKTAYNLDGGGSSTMYFKGEVVNQPTTFGHGRGGERSVSDIVYIGREG